MATLTRRSLMRGSAAAAATYSLASLGSVRRTRPGSPGDDVRVAVVGVRGRGNSHISGFQSLPGVDVVALVDVDANVLAERKAQLDKNKSEQEGWAGGGVDCYEDLRVLLEREDVDVVSIATPNHLHALQTIWSCQAGKHVYVEKPVCHNIFEGRQMVRAAEKHGRVVQAGTQSRSSQGIAQGIQFMREGGLGAIQYAHGTCFKPRKSIGKIEGPQPVPEHVNWDLYCGPAPRSPLMRRQLHYDWHWQFATGNGDLGNQGIHQVDTCRWALGVDELAPAVGSIGGRFGYDDDGDTPNTQMMYLAYEPAPLLFEVRGLPRDQVSQPENWNSSMDRIESGSIGTTVHCEGGYLCIPNTNRESMAYDNEGNLLQHWEGASSHFANFIEAVRADDSGLLTAPILEGFLSSSLCHMGNISYLLGESMDPKRIREELGSHELGQDSFQRFVAHLDANGVDLARHGPVMGPLLSFDIRAEKFTNSRAANQLTTREYRAPFTIGQEI